jgi:hypothetical protein
MAAARAFPINRPHPSHKHRRKHNGKHRPVRVVAAVASDRPLKPIDSTMKSKYLLVVYAAFLIIFLVQFAGKTVPHHPTGRGSGHTRIAYGDVRGHAAQHNRVG